jgi:filamentous hemagglutinin
MSGANGALGADLYNRQDHPEEKEKARKIAADAKARGITNPDGSPITVEQIENAMRAANNSDYGETITTGMVVPLKGSTKSSQLYDTTGMLVTNDGAGNNYLVQDPSMLTSPSDTVRNLILQDTGGASSPYSWNVPSPQSAQAAGGAPKVDPNGPFSPASNGCVTADCAAGLPESRQTSLPAVTFTVGPSGTFVLGYGVSAGAGVYLTPGFGKSTFDAGIYATYGTGYGFDPSLALSTGFNKGSAADLRGVASNSNLGAAFADVGVGGSVTYAGGQATGGSYSFGIKGVPSVAGGTASVTNMTTCTFGISNIASGFTQALCK